MSSTTPTLVVVGDGGVGKTSVIIRYTKDKFTENYEPTLEDNYKAQIQTADGKTLDIEIADTAGQDDYQSLRDKYIETGDVFLVVYSVAEQRTLQKAKEILNSIKAIKNTFKFILIGNKVDVPNRSVTFEDGKSLATELNGKFLETSAKTGTNVKAAFQEIGSLLQTENKQSEGGCCRI